MSYVIQLFQKLCDLQLPILSISIQMSNIYVLTLWESVFFFLTYGETKKLLNIYNFTIQCKKIFIKFKKYFKFMKYFTSQETNLLSLLY